MFTRTKLGVSTWTFGPLPLPRIARTVADLAYDGVVLQVDERRYSAAEARQILDDQHLSVFGLTPDNVDLAHEQPARRQAALDHYRQLIDFAAVWEAQAPVVTIRGFIGRTQPFSTLAAEEALVATAVQQLATEAQTKGVRLVLAVHNRYETHLLNSGAQALALCTRIACENVGIALDAFHMNIEEQDAATTIRQVGSRLWLYHMADSNRQAIGRGHTKLGAHLWGLEDSRYSGPIILTCLPPGAAPVSPVLTDQQVVTLETYLTESRSWF